MRISTALILGLGCREPSTTPSTAEEPGTTSVADPTTTVPDWCGADDLARAAGPVDISGFVGVPVDFEAVSATFSIDAVAQTATAEAAVLFQLGPDAGMPLLDLRQEPLTVELDGESIDPDDFDFVRVGDEPDSDLRLLRRDLGPCGVHVLVVTYVLALPLAEQARPIAFEDGAVRWDLWLGDLYPGRYLEQWAPANLVWDRFALTVDLSLTSDTAHTLLTNGQVTGSDGDWQIEYPPTFTALSPMLVLGPSTDWVSTVQTEMFDDGTVLDIELHREVTVPDTDPPLYDRIVAAVATNLADTGPWIHGDRLVVDVWDEPTRAMEYDGATTTVDWALEHELFHSWYGRGLRPAHGPAGWIDEAWDEYVTSDRAFEVEERTFQGSDPVELDDGDPFGRSTNTDAYTEGRELFAHLAFLMGLDALREAMAELYLDRAPDPIDTADLEAHLYCWTGQVEVYDAIGRWARGLRRVRDPEERPDCL